MRVLFLETDPISSEVRLRPLLDQLVRAGDIEGYAVVDRDMSVSPKGLPSYDVAVTHRIPNARQIAWLQRHRPPLLYDIDDLLLRRGCQTLGQKQRDEQGRLSWCLSHADVITSPSPRLIRTLGERHGGSLRDRTHLLPNCGRETIAEERLQGQPKLLWVSSSAHRWTVELRDIAEGIEAACRELRVELHLIGRFPPQLTQMFSSPILARTWTSFPRFMEGLSTNPCVAVVPLACGLPPEDQEFLNCKSDIKAAQYGSSRIASIFSPALPYLDSDLACQTVPDNTASAWQAATATLIEAFPSSGNSIGEHRCLLARRPSVVATTLLGLLESARQPSHKRFSFRAIPSPRLGRFLEQRFRSALAWLR